MQNKNNSQIELVKTKHSSLVTVKLNLEHVSRYIGNIDFSGDGTFIVKRKERHLFRKSQSLGINYSLLTDESIKFKHILILYENKKLYSSRKYFLEKGKPFQFSSCGYELQMFVPISEMNYENITRYEKANGTQECLFSNVI